MWKLLAQRKMILARPGFTRTEFLRIHNSRLQPDTAAITSPANASIPAESGRATTSANLSFQGRKRAGIVANSSLQIAAEIGVTLLMLLSFWLPVVHARGARSSESLLPAASLTPASPPVGSPTLPLPSVASMATSPSANPTAAQATPLAIRRLPPTPTAPSVPVEQLSPAPSPSPSPTVPPRPAASPTSTAAAPLSAERRTPPTLMLHPRTPAFNSVAFLESFIQILQAQEMELTTYQTITAHPELTALQSGRLFIITIDDVSLQAPLDPSIQAMIALLQKAKVPAVLGVVTDGRAANEATAGTLKQLAAQGWEIAAHTDTHPNLWELEKISQTDVRAEIRTCADKIAQAVGVRPVTLVLPFGQMIANPQLIYKERIQWVVGINGGEAYRTTSLLYYVGREGPDGDPQLTFRVMMRRFNP